ncbi:MAG: hypothetical protein FWG87_14660 [Defluviitaleaceae bacterium]|nr:hypothetical protein [Defluviitaleaceae bacterium]
MRKQFRRNAGLALPTVVLFIIMMATVGTLMVVVSNRSMRMSNATPTLDGHYYAAESAINRAMVGLVSDVSDFTDADVEAAALQAVKNITTAVSNAFVGFTPPSSVIADPESAAFANAIANHLMDSFDSNSTYQAGIRNAVHDYISELVVLPNPQGGAFNSDVSAAYFWLIGTTDTSPMDGFNTPGYANLVRVGTGADADKVQVGLVSVSATNPIMASLVVGHPDYHPDHTDETPGLRMYKTNITIKPYITFESYAGTVTGGQAITQDIAIPIGKFDVFFGIQHYASGGGADSPFFGIIPDSLHVGSDDTTFNGGTVVPDVIPLEPYRHDLMRYRAGIFNKVASKISSATVDTEQNPDNLGNAIQQAIGSIPINIPPNGNWQAMTSIEVVVINGESRLRLDGNGTANTLANTVPIPDDNTLVFAAPYTGATLIGDFTGINVIVKSGSVTLGSGGSDPKPFISNNSVANETVIWSSGEINVNVSDGMNMNNVTVGSFGGNMNILSHGEPGKVHMNAIFAAERMEGNVNNPDATPNVIKAAEWDTNQLPQFYVNGQMQLAMEGIDKDGNGIAMSGLFANADGSQVKIDINNGGADFNGIIAAPPSHGSHVRGNTNFIVPPKITAEAMDVVPALDVQINSGGGGGGGGGGQSPSFSSNSWDTEEGIPAHSLPDTGDTPSFHTNP